MTTRKDIQRRNVRAHDSHVSGPTQVSITQQQHDGNNVRMAPMLELAIVGGLGVLILVAPTVSTLIKLQVCLQCALFTCYLSSVDLYYFD